MEASTSKNHTPFTQTSRGKNPRPEFNHEHKFNNNEDMEVDIINLTPDEECDFVQSQSENATISSSSFGDTFTNVGNHESDDEVTSELHEDTGIPMRKKRLTLHWRKYIQPLMWRCKWIELRIKQFQLQAANYDKELEKEYQEKQLKYKNFELEGLCSKAMPFFHDSERKKLMKRKIRKRIEELDTDVYMSRHNIFSFLASSRSPNNGVTMDDDQTNPATSTEKNNGSEFKVPDELLSLDFRDEFSLEQILWKIEVAKLQVGGMKTRLETVMNENAGRFSSTEDLMLLESNNALTIEQPTPSKNRDGGPSVAAAAIASQLMQFNMGDVDLVKPDIVDPSLEKETQVQEDVIEDTQQNLDASRKRSSDGILIYNRRAKKPQTDSTAVKIHPIENLQTPKEEKVDSTPPVSVSEDSSQTEQPAPKLRSVSKLTSPKNKKKRAARARRKSGSSLWSRRNSG